MHIKYSDALVHTVADPVTSDRKCPVTHDELMELIKRALRQYRDCDLEVDNGT